MFSISRGLAVEFKSTRKMSSNLADPTSPANPRRIADLF